METRWKTHDIKNQYDELTNYNLFETDLVLKDFIEENQFYWIEEELSLLGECLGRYNIFNKGKDANAYTPILRSFDLRGRRINEVDFHPSWHWFMRLSKKSGVISRPYEDEKPGRWVFSSAVFLLQSQVEAGSLCPATMTQAAIPILQKEPQLWRELGTKLLSRFYDKRDLPLDQKKSIWVGMGITEKQGGSDVRSNSTIATPLKNNENGYREYTLCGHKWFFSAPTSDAHLVVARIDKTEMLSCFFVPRWKLNGEKNEIIIQRLKNKVGNRSNASGEIEFIDAWAIEVGDSGLGIQTIIEMATYTRLNCVIGSSAIIRQCVVQAINYARNREAFGKQLCKQPLMRTLLVDLALISEAATLTSMHLSLAFENEKKDPISKAWKRIVTPAAKFFVCKKAIEITAEVMEIFGGNGYIEDTVISRMYKEAPVNSIWEGSGNIMCLDVLRAIVKDAVAFEILVRDIRDIASDNEVIQREINDFLEKFELDNASLFEPVARCFIGRFMGIIQASLLHKYSPKFVTEAFVKTRFLDSYSGSVLGAINCESIDIDKIIERAFPTAINH